MMEHVKALRRERPMCVLVSLTRHDHTIPHHFS